MSTLAKQRHEIAVKSVKSLLALCSMLHVVEFGGRVLLVRMFISMSAAMCTQTNQRVTLHPPADHHMGQQLRRGVQYPHGVAYLNKHTPQTTLQLAAEFLVDAERVLPRRRVTFLEGYSGALALQAAMQKEAGDVQAATETLQVWL